MSRTRPEIDVHPHTLPASALPTRVYDVVVIGGGPGGEMTAARVVRGGLTALLVEAELVGGECLYWACVPSKALLRPSETIESAKAVGGARQRWEILAQKYAGKPQVDLQGLWERRDMFTKGWKDDGFAMRDLGAEVAHGFGSVSGVKRVAIRDWHSGEVVEVEARQAVVIATGSAPVIPEIEGLKDSGYWTPREAVSASEVPEHLVILGAGAVGTEMATFYNQIGSKVTLIASKVLPKVVPEAGRMVEESLVKAGVDVKLGIKVTKVSRIGEAISVTLSNGETIQGTELLVATGRNARTNGMGLERVGAPSDGAWIEVDDSMTAISVSGGWLYAVGDPNGRALMTHIAKYQAKIAGDSIVAKSNGTYQDEPNQTGEPIAQAIFTDPQVGAVGLTLEQAASKRLKAKAVSTKMAGPGTFLHAEGYEGWAQWVIEEGTDRLLGATFVGRDAVHQVQASTMAIVGKLTLDQLWHVTPPFPTMSEVYTSLSEAAEK